MTLVLVIAACLASHAQVTAATTAVEKEVRAVEAARIAATTANDFDALDRLLADDLTYTHSNAQLDTKSQFLETLRSGRTRYRVIEPSDVQVRVYGSVAVLTGRARVSVVTNNQPNEILLRFTSAWAQRDGRWQFVAWQSTRIPQQ
jgi:ketosteroid isomerase-like protein